MSDRVSSVSIAYLSGIVQYLREAGFAVADILAETRIQESDLNQKNGRVSAADYVQVFANGERLSADPQLGLKVGQLVRPGNYGVIGYVVMASRTFGEALARAGRYQKLVGNIGYSDVHIDGEVAEIRWQTDFTDLPAALVEEHIASIVSFARWFTGQDKDPLAICFTHQKQDVTGYETFFRCPVRFGEPVTAVQLPVSYADIPLPQFDLDLCTWLDKKAAAEMAALEAEDELLESVKKVLRNRLPDGVPSLEQVSDWLALPESRLKRELQQLGMPFKRLLDHTRHQLALGYIANAQIELQELAFLLGFSEQSAFQRAFKRWTGTTPGRYRKSLATAA